MKKAILIGVVLVSMLFLLPSCAAGVSSEEYAKVSTDLAVAQAKIEALQTELSANESELQTVQSQLEAANEKLEQGNARMEILNAIFIPAITGELDRMTETESVNYFFEWRDKIMDIGDSVLTTKFQAIIDSGGSNEALTNFFIYLLESIPKALE